MVFLLEVHQSIEVVELGVVELGVHLELEPMVQAVATQTMLALA
jgi:hypothetical protein